MKKSATDNVFEYLVAEKLFIFTNESSELHQLAASTQ
jgi:hypothetical protein